MGSKDRNKQAAREESKASEQVEDTGTKGLEKTEESKTQPPGSFPSIQWLRVEVLTPHPLNAKIYGDHCPGDLIKSVAASGILAPLIVTPENILISGHRRWSAAKLAGIQEVPVIERETADDEELCLLLLECNTGRHKTTEQLIREYREIKRIEESFAAKRGGARTDLRPDSTGGHGRARDLAAARVGHLSATTLELGDKILSVLDEKAECENICSS